MSDKFKPKCCRKLNFDVTNEATVFSAMDETNDGESWKEKCLNNSIDDLYKKSKLYNFDFVSGVPLGPNKDNDFSWEILTNPPEFYLRSPRPKKVFQKSHN